MKTWTRFIAAALCTSLIGCGDGRTDLSDALPELRGNDTLQVVVADTAPSAVPVPSDTAVPDPAEQGWTAGVTSRSRSGMQPATLKGVRSARNLEWDRTVWEFGGDSVPGYHVEYVDRPVRRCGSGETVEIAGDGWLQVRLEPAQAHDEAGRATIGVADRSRMPNLPVLQQVEQTCDFEAVAEWVLGVAVPNRYRVMELRDPARLVVDIRH